MDRRIYYCICHFSLSKNILCLPFFLLNGKATPLLEVVKRSFCQVTRRWNPHLVKHYYCSSCCLPFRYKIHERRKSQDRSKSAVLVPVSKAPSSPCTRGTETVIHIKDFPAGFLRPAITRRETGVDEWRGLVGGASAASTNGESACYQRSPHQPMSDGARGYVCRDWLLVYKYEGQSIDFKWHISFS